ncbi:MAG: hypothetical protein ACT4QC_16260 [Planctomycetaceae bacterium]
MINWRDELLERLQRYSQRHGCGLRCELGFGYDGIVFSTDRQSALKALRFASLFERERNVYERLRDNGVQTVLGFAVPHLMRVDEELWIIEMTIVSPPFVLDFAGAYLDTPPDYPEEVMETWRAEKAEQFGERWAEVRRVMSAFRQWGIYLADVKPGNIEF